MLVLLASAVSLLLLSACAPTPLQPEPASAPEPPVIVTAPDSPIETPTLIEQRQQALATQNWPDYLDTTETLLLISNPSQQESLLLETYQQLNAIPSKFWHDTQVFRYQAWSSLAETHQLAMPWQNAWLQDTASIYAEHSPTQHLIKLLRSNMSQPRRIAILLPSDERTATLSNQIRAGILAAYWQTQQRDQLLFFNLEDYSSPIEAYKATQEAQVDWVIGPYDRNNIDKLSAIADDRLIFLNTAPNAPHAWQLQLQTPNATEQLLQQISTKNYRNLAVLYANQPSAQNSLASIDEIWLTTPLNRVIPLSFEQNQRNLRDELSRALQNDQSQIRANFLQRTIGHNLAFFPRHRSDLDVLLLLGDREYLANIQPQLDFFQTHIPLYATDTLMPTRFMTDHREPDLKNINFLSYPGALAPELIGSPIEALGWDAFLITQYAPELKAGLALNGATGQLRRQNTGLMERTLAMLAYNQRGQIYIADNAVNLMPFANFTGLAAPTHPRDRQQNKRELLELITQPTFTTNPTSNED
ncbi:penicillin-binding protein activator [Thiomicrospira sp. ALE5]|uniref:penicillin-binding protein activator n=1 Tax=Thiomicrospira sp. ALE5 TaxID=748650 RepID=UPI0008EA971C|nr:penicillin-binding protein activator [Thiomicrospira sp. ALE5]SFR60910.1 hypothetical protein SAMN03092900_1682 [Thiomicrospira sp. ALE5]